MAIFRIPGPLRPYTSGRAEVNVQGSTVMQAVGSLVAEYPGLRPHLLNEHGRLRPFVNLFVGANQIVDVEMVETPLAEGDRILIIPSIAGG